MKILIVSDTHGSFYELKNVIASEKPIDVLIHCGDVCGEMSAALGHTDYHVHVVQGNCDFPGKYPAEEIFSLQDHRVFLTHGHRYRVNYDSETLCRKAKQENCDIAMYGHTHIPESTVLNGIYILNPGSIAQPRTEDGRPSYAVMTIDDRTGQCACKVRYLDSTLTEVFR